MAAIRDYISLRLAAGDLVGNRVSSDVMDGLVRQAEGELQRDLRVRHMLKTSDLIFTNGEAPLPDDYLETLLLSGLSGQLYRERPAGSLSESWGADCFYVNGSSIIIPQQSTPLTLDYYATLPTITASATTTNWLLILYPLAYLYAVSAQLAIHLRDVEKTSMATQLLSDQIERIRIEDERARFGNAKVRFRGYA